MRVKLAIIVRSIVLFSLVCFWQNVFAAESAVSLQKGDETISQPANDQQKMDRRSEFVPAPPDFNAKSYILIDADTGYVIAEKNADQRLSPASLTKVMSLYLIADALKAGRLNFADDVAVSENAWRMEGARMFIKPGSNVSVRDLISGIVVTSGNDATVAMSEHMAGSEQSFVSLMNKTARNLGMNDTNFTCSTGLPDVNHYSTARDLALLSNSWIRNFPDYYPWFKEKWFTYNEIKQPNRNRLLWKDPSVDGIKTGLTDDAGYCLIASAERNNMRLILVILGVGSDDMRNKYSASLLNYGFRFFETRKLFAGSTSLTTPRIWLGKEKTVALGLKDDVYITLPIGQASDLKAKAVVNNHIKAPITKGQACGTLEVKLGSKTVVSRPLIALKSVKRTNFVFALYDYALMLFQH